MRRDAGTDRHPHEDQSSVGERVGLGIKKDAVLLSGQSYGLDPTDANTAEPDGRADLEPLNRFIEIGFHHCGAFEPFACP